MGDDSPDDMELVCPSCEAEFAHQGSAGRLPSVPCPECGAPVEVRGDDQRENVEPASRATPQAQIVDPSSGDGDEATDEQQGNDSTRTLMGVGSRAVSADERDEPPERDTQEASGDGGTPIGRISKETRKEEAEERDDENVRGSQGNRLSDLKQRLENARGSNDGGSSDNPFKNDSGGVGEEKTRVAAEPQFDESFEEGADEGADDALEVTVEGETSEDDEKMGGGSSIPRPDVGGFGGEDEQISDPRAEYRDTKPAGEEIPPLDNAGDTAGGAIPSPDQMDAAERDDEDDDTEVRQSHRVT